MNNVKEFIIDFVNRINTTSVVVLTGVGLMWTTALRYLLSDIHIENGVGFGKWEPSIEWLAAVLAFAGVATTQLLGKRSTDHEALRIKAGAKQPQVTVETANVQAGDVVVETETKPKEPTP